MNQNKGTYEVTMRDQYFQSTYMRLLSPIGMSLSDLIMCSAKSVDGPQDHVCEIHSLSLDRYCACVFIVLGIFIIPCYIATE